MSSLRIIFVAVALLLMISISACGSTPTPVPTPTSAPTVAPTATSVPTVAPTATSVPTVAPIATSTPTAVPTATSAPTATSTPIVIPTIVGEPGAKEFDEFNPKNFDRPTVITNEWFPLKPGTQLVYDGVTDKDGKPVPHRVVFTITDLTKVINGVRTVVIYDVDYTDNEVREKELTFFAQDNDGNVWHLGQYREEYDAGTFIGSQAWLVGHLKGARAGIMMHARNEAGKPSYSEGYAPAPFNWTDRGRVSQVGQKIKVPFGSYEDVLVIEEFSQEEPKAAQLKYYARGVGIIRVGWKGADPTRESLELVDHFQLSPKALDEARAQALELEDRGYVYGRTPPAEQTK